MQHHAAWQYDNFVKHTVVLWTVSSHQVQAMPVCVASEIQGERRAVKTFEIPAVACPIKDTCRRSSEKNCKIERKSIISGKMNNTPSARRGGSDLCIAKGWKNIIMRLRDAFVTQIKDFLWNHFINWVHASIYFFYTLQHPSYTLKTPYKIISFFRSKNGRKKKK